MNTLNFCPLCKNSNIYKYRKIANPSDKTCDIIPGVKIEIALVSEFYRCVNCEIIFQNPRMSDKELTIFYSKGYYRQMIGSTDELKNKDELERAKYDSKIIGEYVCNVNKHLDIGCSRGYLLSEVGAKIKVGVESNKDYVTVENIKVYPDIKKVPSGKYDLITVIHALEHMSSPPTFLKKIVSLMSSNGYLVIEVPTWNSPGGSLRLAHLYHFEPDVLENICKNVGLEVVDTKFTPHLLMILKLDSSSRHFSNPQ